MKNEWIFRFYVTPGDDGFKRWLCNQQLVSYVLAAPFEREFMAMRPEDHPWLVPVYESGTAAVYRVDLAR